MVSRSLIVVIAAFVAFAPGPISAQDRGLQRSFAAGGTVHLDLTAGRYNVTTAPDDRIRVIPTIGDASIRLTTNASGTRADVRVVAPQDQSTLNIELPQRVNLVVSLDGGALYVSGVEGDTDISAKAGDIEVSHMGHQSYRHVAVALQHGVLSAPAFGPKEGSDTVARMDRPRATPAQDPGR